MKKYSIQTSKEKANLSKLKYVFLDLNKKSRPERDISR